MSFVLKLTGYDLSDEGPGRTVNEDSCLVREDLGLFALADGAGGRGRGDVAANLALRSVENYVGSTVKRSHDRPDRDLLGISEQAKRLSAAVHQAHLNILEVIHVDPKREGMATTIVAALIAPRTNQVHIAHVGDSRCYRIRHRRLERLTVDDTIATDVLEMRPETPDAVLERLPRNSVVRALGMKGDLRVRVTSHDLYPGDVFLLSTDGLTSYVSTETIWEVMREGDPPHVIASELLNHALAARSQDNISVLVIECAEEVLDEAVDTRRYAEEVRRKPSAPPTEGSDSAPNSADLSGPEILTGSILDEIGSDVEPVEEWGIDSDYPTLPLERAALAAAKVTIQRANAELSAELLELAHRADTPPSSGSAHGPYSIGPEDFEAFEDESETS